MPPPSGWYQQNMTGLSGRSITGMTFTDSLTGYAVTSGSSTSMGYILKTTDGGDNWFKKDSINAGFNKIQFINSDTGFASLKLDRLYKTTNGGENWFYITQDIWPNDMHVLNNDTIYLVSEYDYWGGVFRTTNGGQTWQTIFNAGTINNPDKIYMYNKDIGFICRTGTSFFKTTNGGINWIQITGYGTFSDICFVDSLTGWKCQGIIQKTTDGGYTWTTQQLPQGGIISTISMINLHCVNRDTIWGVGGQVYIPTPNKRGIIYKTTNGGINWGYQLPDTHLVNIWQYTYINFVDNLKGWSYLKNGVRTVTGGMDTTIYTSVNNNISISNQNYELFQNYPNPFNSITNIKFKMLNSGFAEIKVYDITGKLIRVLTRKKYEPGEHTVRFDAAGFPSGVYFYRLTAGEYNAVKKMVLIR